LKKKSVFDEYGESIRPEDYIAVAKTLQPEDSIIQLKKVEEDVMDEEPVEETPTKSIRQKYELSINCKIQYIDFEGRSDGRSIKKILNHVQPRKLILIHGVPDATEHLVNYCEKSLNPNSLSGFKRVVAPKTGETIDVTEASDLYRLNLKSNFLESLNFRQIGSKSSIAYVEGIIMVPPQEQDEDGQWHQPEPYLDVLPHGEFPSGHDAIFVGDVKLYDFRQKLTEQGYKAEFKGGSLVVNGEVILRRETEGGNSTINIEGTISEDYYKIRDLLYAQFHIL